MLIVGFILFKEYRSGNLAAKENLKEIEKLEETLDEEPTKEGSNELKEDSYYSIENIYDIMHRMSNGKILAEDNKIWGVIPIYKEDIVTLKKIIKKVDYEDREYLLEVLTRWEKGDFSQVVDEHNYFWKKLGGTVGKAIQKKE